MAQTPRHTSARRATRYRRSGFAAAPADRPLPRPVTGGGEGGSAVAVPVYETDVSGCVSPIVPSGMTRWFALQLHQFDWTYLRSMLNSPDLAHLTLV